MEALNISQDDDDSDTSQEDIEEGEPELRYRKWMRSPLASQTSSNMEGDIGFMVMDCDFGILPTAKVNSDLLPQLHPQLQNVDGEQSYLRLHGVNRGGHSICLNVFNFLPYFYVIPIPSSGFTESHIPRLKELLTSAIKGKMLLEMKSVPYHGLLTSSDPIISIQFLDQSGDSLPPIFDLIQLSQPSSTKSTILKVTCRVPRFVWAASKILKEGQMKMDLDGGEAHWKFEVYEGSINHTIRFLTDLNIPGCSWVQVDAGSYFQRRAEEKLSHAQLEFDVTYTAITKKPSEISIPPLRILSFDLEVMVRPPVFAFPRNGAEPILQIGNVLGVYSAGENELDNQLTKVVFTLKSCDDIPDTEIYSFDTEEEMLGQWRLFLLAFDPDLITGYNIKKFDLPYILQRANRINIKSTVPFLGRVRKVASHLRPIKNKSKAFNRYDTMTLNLNGRVILDMFLLIQRHNPVPNYTQTKGGEFTLAEVAKRYLGQGKEDVSYLDIFELQHGGPDTRKKLATYCVQDALLVYLLMMLHQYPSRRTPSSTFDILEYYVERARETGVPLKYLLTKSLDYQSYYKRVRLEKNPVIVYNTPVKRSIGQVEPGTPPRPPKKFTFSRKCNFSS